MKFLDLFYLFSTFIEELIFIDTPGGQATKRRIDLTTPFLDLMTFTQFVTTFLSFQFQLFPFRQKLIDACFHVIPDFLCFMVLTFAWLQYPELNLYIQLTLYLYTSIDFLQYKNLDISL